MYTLLMCTEKDPNTPSNYRWSFNFFNAKNKPLNHWIVIDEKNILEEHRTIFSSEGLGF